jgi:hypothetical protein
VVFLLQRHHQLLNTLLLLVAVLVLTVIHKWALAAAALEAIELHQGLRLHRALRLP